MTMAIERLKDCETKLLKVDTFDESQTTRQRLLPGLPNEIAVCCLARVPLSDCSDASAVCRSWQHFFQTRVFWDIRRELAISEQLLLLWSEAPYEYNVWHGFFPSTKKWFRLPTRPDDHTWLRRGWSSAFVAVDKKLFMIGGWQAFIVNGKGRCDVSAAVSYFDLQCFEWKVAASLNVARAYCMAGVIDNRLYVCGGRTQFGTTDTAEVYDHTSQRWKLVARMPLLTEPRCGLDTVAMNGKFYVASDRNDWSWKLKGIVYDPQKDEWTKMQDGLNYGWCNRPVEHNRKLHCQRYRSFNDGGPDASIWRYEETEDTWKLFHCLNPLTDRSCHGRTGGWNENEQLVTLGGELRLVSKRRGCVDDLTFDITDVSKNLIASKSFHPRTIEEMRFSEYNHSDQRIRCEVVTL